MARKPVRPELSGPGSCCRLAAVMVLDVRATAVPPLLHADHVPLRVPARLAPGPLSVRRPTVLGTRARSDSARR